MPLSKNDIKKKLGINSWGELNNPAGFDRYLALFPEIRTGTHLRIVDEVPDYPILVSSYLASVIDKAETVGAPPEKIDSLVATIQWLTQKDSLTVHERQQLFARINEAIGLAKSLGAPNTPRVTPGIIEVIKTAVMSFGAMILIIGAWIFRIKLIESEETE